MKDAGLLVCLAAIVVVEALVIVPREIEQLRRDNPKLTREQARAIAMERYRQKRAPVYYKALSGR